MIRVLSGVSLWRLGSCSRPTILTTPGGFSGSWSRSWRSMTLHVCARVGSASSARGGQSTCGTVTSNRNLRDLRVQTTSESRSECGTRCSRPRVCESAKCETIAAVATSWITSAYCSCALASILFLYTAWVRAVPMTDASRLRSPSRPWSPGWPYSGSTCQITSRQRGRSLICPASTRRQNSRADEALRRARTPTKSSDSAGEPAIIAAIWGYRAPSFCHASVQDSLVQSPIV